MKPITINEHKGEKLDIYNYDSRKFCQQEIGRRDISKTPIKEGDIVLVHDKLEWGGVVIYNDKGCGFCFENDDNDAYSFSHGWGEGQASEPEDSWKVVGSIYGDKNEKDLFVKENGYIKLSEEVASELERVVRELMGFHKERKGRNLINAGRKAISVLNVACREL